AQLNRPDQDRMKKVGICIRVSTEEQARIQDASLVSQRKRLEEYVEGQCRRDPKWGRIVGIYCDEGRSAKDMNRPEFQRLLQDVWSHDSRTCPQSSRRSPSTSKFRPSRISSRGWRPPKLSWSNNGAR